MNRFKTALLSLVLAAGCTAQDERVDEDPVVAAEALGERARRPVVASDLATRQFVYEPVVPPPPASGPTCGDQYQLVSRLDLTAAVAMPSSLDGAVQVLRQLQTSPGAAILGLAEEAGVPAFDEIMELLPGALESRLAGWIDDALAGTGVAELAAEIIVLVDAPFANVELESTLSLATGAHTLGGAAIVMDNQRLGFALEAVPSLPGLSAQPAVSVEGLEVSIGEHRFGLRFGSAAWAAIEAAAGQRYGASLSSVIQEAVNCDAVAAEVADRCIYGLCVGHESELRELCVEAVNHALGKVEDEVRSVDFDAVIFASGTGLGADMDAARVATTITGTWDAQLDIGMGPSPVGATFTGAVQ
jgi:hypothetical protein